MRPTLIRNPSFRQTPRSTQSRTSVWRVTCDVWCAVCDVWWRTQVNAEARGGFSMLVRFTINRPWRKRGWSSSARHRRESIGNISIVKCAEDRCVGWMTCVVRRRSSTRSTALIAPPSLPASGSTMTRNTFLKQMRYVCQRNRVYHELLTYHIDLWLDIAQHLVVIGSTISAKLFHRSSCVRFSCTLRSTTRTSYAASSFGQIQSFLERGWAKFGKQLATKFVGVTFVK